MMKIKYIPNLKIINMSDLKAGDVFKYDGELFIKSKKYNEAYNIDHNCVTVFTGPSCTPVKKYEAHLTLKEVL